MIKNDKLKLFLHSFFSNAAYVVWHRFFNDIFDKPFKEHSAFELVRFVVLGLSVMGYYSYVINKYINSKHISKKVRYLLYISSLIISMISVLFILKGKPAF